MLRLDLRTESLLEAGAVAGRRGRAARRQPSRGRRGRRAGCRARLHRVEGGAGPVRTGVLVDRNVHRRRRLSTRSATGALPPPSPPTDPSGSTRPASLRPGRGRPRGTEEGRPGRGERGRPGGRTKGAPWRERSPPIPPLRPRNATTARRRGHLGTYRRPGRSPPPRPALPAKGPPPSRAPRSLRSLARSGPGDAAT